MESQASQSGSTRRSRLPVFVLLLPLLLGAVADADENQARVLGVEATPCPVRLLAGEHTCPGCGLTRGTALAVQGEWGRSWNVHPAGILIAVLCVLGLALRFWMRVDPNRAPVHAVLLRHGHVIFVLGILAAWIVRLIR